MKAGRVVRVRINPADCMSCIDIVRQLGAITPGISFSQIVSLGLRSALQTLRDNGVIPTRDGFEFAAMMEPFTDNPSVDRARKLDISQTIDNLSTIPGIGGRAAEPEVPISDNEIERYQQLRKKAKTNAGAMTIEEVEEYSRLAVKVGEQG